MVPSDCIVHSTLPSCVETCTSMPSPAGPRSWSAIASFGSNASRKAISTAVKAPCNIAARYQPTMHQNNPIIGSRTKPRKRITEKAATAFSDEGALPSPNRAKFPTESTARTSSCMDKKKLTAIMNPMFSADRIAGCGRACAPQLSRMHTLTHKQHEHTFRRMRVPPIL